MNLQPGIQTALPWAEYQPALQAIQAAPAPLPDWDTVQPECLGLRVVSISIVRGKP